MTIKRFENHQPDIHATAYVDDMAYVKWPNHAGRRRFGVA